MHTKGKWEVNTEDADLYIYAENETIGHIYDYTDRAKGIANARRIVQCVNNFDALLEACHNAIGAYEALEVIGAYKELPGFKSCLKFLRDAIAAAEKGE